MHQLLRITHTHWASASAPLRAGGVQRHAVPSVKSIEHAAAGGVLHGITDIAWYVPLAMAHIQTLHSATSPGQATHHESVAMPWRSSPAARTATTCSGIQKAPRTI